MRRTVCVAQARPPAAAAIRETDSPSSRGATPPPHARGGTCSARAARCPAVDLFFAGSCASLCACRPGEVHSNDEALRLLLEADELGHPMAKMVIEKVRTAMRTAEDPPAGEREA